MTRIDDPRAGFDEELNEQEAAMIAQIMSCAAIGGPETVRAQLSDFIARTGADELMLTAHIYDHKARLRSFELIATCV